MMIYNLLLHTSLQMFSKTTEMHNWILSADVEDFFLLKDLTKKN